MRKHNLEPHQVAELRVILLHFNPNNVTLTTTVQRRLYELFFAMDRGDRTSDNAMHSHLYLASQMVYAMSSLDAKRTIAQHPFLEELVRDLLESVQMLLKSVEVINGKSQGKSCPDF